MNNNHRWYHVSREGLRKGEVIEAGNWGRIVLSSPEHPWFDMENIVEAARLQHAPHLPSRLTAAYVFDDALLALHFRNIQRPDETVYEVELTNVNAVPFRTSLQLIAPHLDSIRWPGALEENAIRYWTNPDETELMECLVDSDLRMLEKLF